MMTKILVTFFDTMLSHSFLPFITTPTRITRNTKTLIDNIFYNKPLNDIKSGNLSSIFLSMLLINGLQQWIGLFYKNKK